MQSHVSATFASRTCREGVCVVNGYGVRVRINRRQLVVSDGIGRHRRERSFTKASPGIKRLVVIGHEGYVTFDALRWLGDAGIVFCQIDRDGQVMATSDGYGLNDARLRRALALAPANRAGLEIARRLLSAKLAGQARVLLRPEFGATEVDLGKIAEQASNALSIRDLLRLEADGALTYWSAWSKVEVRFARKDAARAPGHWCRFGQRGSPITNSPRLAANPANAMLNYLYALLEAETRLACLACGLDPGLGIFHADQKSRDSLVCDVMEAARPAVDEYLLDLLAARTFAVKDFTETRSGVCRVLAPLTHTLAETTARWAKASRARRRDGRSDPCRRLAHSHRTAADDADAVESKCGSRRRAPQSEASGRGTKAGRYLRDLRRTAAQRRAAILRRLPAERKTDECREVHERGPGRTQTNARRGSRPDGQRGSAAQARRGEREATPRGDRVGSHAREARPRSLHARDTAAASGRDTAQDECGDGTIGDDVREDSARVCAASEALGQSSAVAVFRKLALGAFATPPGRSPAVVSPYGRLGAREAVHAMRSCLACHPRVLHF